MRHKKKQRASRLMRSNNVLVFKLIDPIVQSLLFILFVYCLDADNGNVLMNYHDVLLIAIGCQVLSAFINFILNEPGQLKTQRILYLVTIAIYAPVYFYINRNIKEKYMEVVAGRGMMKMPLIEIFILTAGLIICFWYYITCFREIRDLLAKAQKDD